MRWWPRLDKVLDALLDRRVHVDVDEAQAAIIRRPPHHDKRQARVTEGCDPLVLHLHLRHDHPIQ